MKASQWISHKHAFAPGFTQCKLSARFMLVNILISHFTISRKSKRNDRVMMELSASDTAYSLKTKREKSTSTYNNGLAYSCFHLFPLYFSCGPYILKKRNNVFCVKQVVFESRCLK